MSTIGKSEREDLQRLIRQREKVLKSAARQRSAELLADFENQMGQEFAFDQDEVWEAAVKSVAPFVAQAKAKIEQRCRELGIPKMFAPDLNVGWNARGYSNSVEKRRRELRTMAETRIAAIEADAIVKIEMSCLEAQTQLAVSGLTSDAARSFVESIPRIETLMPSLSFEAIAGEADPPVAEQLVSSNALRQQRYRERQRALKSNVTPLVTDALRNASEDEQAA